MTTFVIFQGYTAKFVVALVDATGVPHDLTGATQITAVLPGLVAGQPILESLALARTTTGTTVASSNQLSALASVVGVEVGHLVAGTGIPAATYVTAIVGSVVTMSKNATASGSGVTVTFGNTNVVVSGAAGAGEVQITVPVSDSVNVGANVAAQDLQVSVTNSDGTVSGFLFKGYLLVTAPTYGPVS